MVYICFSHFVCSHLRSSSLLWLSVFGQDAKPLTSQDSCTNKKSNKQSINCKIKESFLTEICCKGVLTNVLIKTTLIAVPWNEMQLWLGFWLVVLSYAQWVHEYWNEMLLLSFQACGWAGDTSVHPSHFIVNNGENVCPVHFNATQDGPACFNMKVYSVWRTEVPFSLAALLCFSAAVSDTRGCLTPPGSATYSKCQSVSNEIAQKTLDLHRIQSKTRWDLECRGGKCQRFWMSITALNLHKDCGGNMSHVLQFANINIGRSYLFS